jgi:hypothetical protein
VGAAFVDAGDAFQGRFHPSELKVDVGAEANLSLNLFYYLETQLKRSCYAHGFSGARRRPVVFPGRAHFLITPVLLLWRPWTGIRSSVAARRAMGARHALDPDHLAAVSVLSADAPGPPARRAPGRAVGRGATRRRCSERASCSRVAGRRSARRARRRVRARRRGDADRGVAAPRGGPDARAAQRGWDGPPRLHAHAGVAHRHAGPPRRTCTFARRTLALRPARSSASCTAWPAAAR